jgi:hypothetical protein
MTREQFIEPKTAELAKQAGFDWECEYRYIAEPNHKEPLFVPKPLGNGSSHTSPAPTQSVLQRWLRETKNIHIQIMFDNSINVNKYYVIIKTKDNYLNVSIKDIFHNFLMSDNHISYFDTFEDALEAAEQKCLTLIIEKREEEIKNAANEYIENIDFSDYVKADAHDAFIAGAEWADVHQSSPWISVEDRPPEKSVGYFSKWVLCRYKRGSRICYHVGMYDYEFDDWSIANVTHWMPIPELQTTK